MHLLLTGAQGFLGSHLHRVLSADGFEVTVTGRRTSENIYLCNLLNESEVEVMIRDIKPDCIIHAAAFVPSSLWEYNDERASKSSLAMFKNLLDASECPVILISSMTVYGYEHSYPVSEDMSVEPVTFYAKGKREAERLLLSDGRPSLTVRIPGLFGLPRKCGLVYNLIKSFQAQEVTLDLPTEPIIWAAMHVDDAAESISKLVTTPLTGSEIINIGYRDGQSISLLVEMLSSIYNKKINYTVSHPPFEFDLSKMAGRGIMPRLNLRDAIVKFGAQCESC